MNAPVKVVAGILRDGEGRVLLGQRPQGTHLEGLWEFPGGKVEQGEDLHQALARELNEELGIDIITSVPLMTIRHRYPEKAVELHVREVMGWEGEIAAREGQQLQWLAPERLDAGEMPEADMPVVTALRLPRIYQITPERKDATAYVAFLRKAFRGGSRFIQIRAGNLPPAGLCELVAQTGSLRHRDEALLILNSGTGAFDPGLAASVDGLHLTSSHLMALEERPEGLQGFLFASCHTPDEIRQAERIGVDMICLSPLYATDSHPDARPLGEEGFSQLCARTSLPVYALGGLRPEHMTRARELGAAGIAGIRAFDRW